MANCRSDKKPPLSAAHQQPFQQTNYQQSFRIDNLLTRKVIEQQQQPDHYAIYSSSKVDNPDILNLTTSPSHDDLISDRADMYEQGRGDSTSSTSGNDADDDLFTRRKKARTAFSREQVAELEKKFQDKKYLSSAERGELAEKLKLSDMQVKTWFQNRRMKYKRQSEETEMEMKSPKYSPYGSFVYRGVAPFYVPMQYKPDMYYPYGSNIRSPQQSPSMEASFQMQLSSPPAMIGLTSHSMTRQPPYLPRTHSSPYNSITPISPSTCYTHSFYNEEVNPSFVEWQRTLQTPPSP